MAYNHEVDFSKVGRFLADCTISVEWMPELFDRFFFTRPPNVMSRASCISMFCQRSTTILSAMLYWLCTAYSLYMRDVRDYL